MPPLYPEVIDLLESSDEEDAPSRSTSLGTTPVEESENGESAISQDLHEVDYDGYVELPADEDEPEDEIVRPRRLLLGEDGKNSASKREAFMKLLRSMENPEDLELLYPASLASTAQNAGCDERKVLRDFASLKPPTSQDLQINDEDSDDEEFYFEELELQDVVVYRTLDHSKGFNGQMEYLHNIASSGANECFLFDGTVCCEGQNRRVIGAKILKVNFGGLDDVSMHTTSNQIWIQSHISKEENKIWYRLGRPAKEYVTYSEASVWISDFSKHVLDYLCEASKKEVKVSLDEFALEFWEQIQIWHGHDDTFRSWHDGCGTLQTFESYLSVMGHFCGIRPTVYEKSLTTRSTMISGTMQL